MNTMTKPASSNLDLEKYRLRRFVDRLVDMGEVEVHDEPVPLTSLGAMIERTEFEPRSSAYSTLMPAALMIGHHFSISAF